MVAIQHLAPRPARRADPARRARLARAETAPSCSRPPRRGSTARCSARAPVLKEHLPERAQRVDGGGQRGGARAAGRYIEACEAGDAHAIKALMHEDARFSMPPEPGLYVGRETIVDGWAEGGFGTRARVRRTFRLASSTAHEPPARASRTTCARPARTSTRWTALDVLADRGRADQPSVTRVLTGSALDAGVRRSPRTLRGVTSEPSYGPRRTPRWTRRSRSLRRRAATQPLARIGKAAKDFLTEVDLASEAAMKAALARLDARHRLLRRGGRRRRSAPRPRVGRRPARRHDQLRHRLAAVRRDARAARGRRARAGRDRPAVPGHARRQRRGRRRRRASTRRSSAWATRSTGRRRAHGRVPALGHATSTARAALPLRRRRLGAVDLAGAGGQIQGMVLAHNNPYDVVAGHAIARAAGAVVTDYAGAPLTLDSAGAMAAVAGRARRRWSRSRADLAAPRAT